MSVVVNVGLRTREAAWKINQGEPLWELSSRSCLRPSERFLFQIGRCWVVYDNVPVLQVIRRGFVFLMYAAITAQQLMRGHFMLLGSLFMVSEPRACAIVNRQLGIFR